MPIKLIKKQEASKNRRKPALQASDNQMLRNTKAWIDEYKAQKVRDTGALLDLAKRI